VAALSPLHFEHVPPQSHFLCMALPRVFNMRTTARFPYARCRSSTDDSADDARAPAVRVVSGAAALTGAFSSDLCSFSFIRQIRSANLRFFGPHVDLDAAGGCDSIRTHSDKVSLPGAVFVKRKILDVVEAGNAAQRRRYI